MTPSTDVAKGGPSPAQTLVAQVRSSDFQTQIAEALPENVSPRRFVRMATTALLTSPKLAECEPDSVFAALLKAAADGLIPDGREAALVKAKIKGRDRVIYLPMIGGFRKVAGEHGWQLLTAAVYEGDLFEYELGLEPKLVHRPAGGYPDGRKVVAAYAIARKRGEPVMLEVMLRDELERIRKTSRAKDSGPWVEWFDRMGEKTAGRRLFAKLPLGEDPRITRILQADELEAGEAEALVYGPSAAGGLPTAASEAPARSVASSESLADEGGEAERSSAEASPPFKGKEPPPMSEGVTDPDPLEAVLLPPDFKAYAGRSIRSIVDAEDRVYLRWLATEAEPTEEIREAAKAGLAELES